MFHRSASICGLSVLLTGSAVHAGTVTVDDYWNGEAEDLPAAFSRAVDAAGSGGVIRLKHRTYQSAGAIDIFRKVTILGKGATKSGVERTGQDDSPLFVIHADGVRINSLSLDGGDQASMGVDGNGSAGLSLSGVSIFDLGENEANGVGCSPGQSLPFFSASFCTFSNYSGSGLLLGDGEKNGDNVGGRFSVKNCKFLKNPGDPLGDFGILVDYGNEDLIAPVSLASDGAVSIVSENFADPMNVASVAVSCVSDLTISHNEFLGGNGSGEESQTVRIEDLSTDIAVRENVLSDSGGGDGVFIGRAAEDPDHERFCSRIEIDNNAFRGSLENGVAGERARSIFVRGNLFEVRPDQAVNFWEQGSDITWNVDRWKNRIGKSALDSADVSVR